MAEVTEAMTSLAERLCQRRIGHRYEPASVGRGTTPDLLDEEGNPKEWDVFFERCVVCGHLRTLLSATQDG